MSSKIAVLFSLVALFGLTFGLSADTGVVTSETLVAQPLAAAVDCCCDSCADCGDAGCESCATCPGCDYGLGACCVENGCNDGSACCSPATHSCCSR